MLSNLNAPEYSHFKGLQIVAGEQKVQLLIGQDNAEALLGSHLHFAHYLAGPLMVLRESVVPLEEKYNHISLAQCAWISKLNFCGNLKMKMFA